MANVEHKDMTGASLHEPKGTAAATVDKVYVADGAGSGTWEKVTEDSLDSGAATLNQVAAADGAGGVTWADAPGKVHGEMTISGNSTATTITTLGTYVTVSEGTPVGEHLSGITFLTDHLIIPSAGTYAVECNISFEGSSGDIFKFDLGIGGVGTPMGHIGRRKTPNADVGSVAIGGIHTLAALDEIYLLVQNEGATGNPTITDANLFIIKIAE